MKLNSKEPQPQKRTYFFKGNLIKNTKLLPKELKEITIANAVDKKFICPCANYFQSQTATYNSPTEYPCYCGGNLLIGWDEIRQELIKEGLDKEYLTDVFILLL